MYLELFLCVPGITFVCTSNYFCVYLRLVFCVRRIIFVCTSNYFCVYVELFFVFFPISPCIRAFAICSQLRSVVMVDFSEILKVSSIS